jgi:hypothetical protein
LLGRARAARGCSTPGDDRLETRASAVKRYLFRLGHAARSARYATSIAQLVVGLIYVSDRADVLAAVNRAAHRTAVPESRFRVRALDDVIPGRSATDVVCLACIRDA